MKQLGVDPNGVYFFPKITLSKKTTWAAVANTHREKEISDSGFAAMAGGIEDSATAVASPAAAVAGLFAATPVQQGNPALQNGGGIGG